MIRWLWKIIVGRKPIDPPPSCARACQWNEGTRQRFYYDGNPQATADEYYVQRCETCGIIRHHVVLKDGRLQL